MSTRDPITKITLKGGRVRYRFKIDVGSSTKPGERRQEVHTHDTYSAAVKARRALLADKDKGKVVARSQVTFGTLCDQWLQRDDIREVTRNGYDYLLRAVRKEIGDKWVHDITRADVAAVVAMLKARKVSHRHIVYTLGTIRQVLDFGIAEGHIGQNHAVTVKAPRESQQDARAVETWDRDHLDASRVLADQEPLEWAVAWRLTLCGLRRSEVLGLAWDAVDLERGEITIKAGRSCSGPGGPPWTIPRARPAVGASP